MSPDESNLIRLRDRIIGACNLDESHFRVVANSSWQPRAILFYGMLILRTEDVSASRPYLVIDPFIFA